MVWSSSNEPWLAVFFAALNKISEQVRMLHKGIDENPSERALWPISNELVRVLLCIHHPILELPCLSLLLVSLVKNEPRCASNLFLILFLMFLVVHIHSTTKETQANCKSTSGLVEKIQY
jgi:hypothetical protein